MDGTSRGSKVKQLSILFFHTWNDPGGGAGGRGKRGWGGGGEEGGASAASGSSDADSWNRALRYPFKVNQGRVHDTSRVVVTLDTPDTLSPWDSTRHPPPPNQISISQRRRHYRTHRSTCNPIDGSAKTRLIFQSVLIRIQYPSIHRSIHPSRGSASHIAIK